MQYRLIIISVACVSSLVPAVHATGILKAKIAGAFAMKGAVLKGAGALLSAKGDALKNAAAFVADIGKEVPSIPQIEEEQPHVESHPTPELLPTFPIHTVEPVLPQLPIHTLQIESVPLQIPIPSVQLDSFIPQLPIPSLQLDSIIPQLPIHTIQVDSISPQYPIHTVQVDSISPHYPIHTVQLDSILPRSLIRTIHVDSMPPQFPTHTVQVESAPKEIHEQLKNKLTGVWSTLQAAILKKTNAVGNLVHTLKTSSVTKSPVVYKYVTAPRYYSMPLMRRIKV